MKTVSLKLTGIEVGRLWFGQPASKPFSISLKHSREKRMHFAEEYTSIRKLLLRHGLSGDFQTSRILDPTIEITRCFQHPRLGPLRRSKTIDLRSLKDESIADLLGDETTECLYFDSFSEDEDE